MKIFHTGDIQIETDEVTGRYRYDEFNLGLNTLFTEFKGSGCDTMVVAGDLFEHWNPSESSRGLAYMFFSMVADVAKNVIITSGNHDLQEQGYNYVEVDGERKPKNDAIRTLVDSLGVDNVQYLEYTGKYAVDTVEFAVWSHKDKIHKRDYNPHSDESDFSSDSEFGDMGDDELLGLLGETPKESTNILIDIFHDPIEGAKSFNGITFNGRPVKVNDFLGKYAIMGDIHKPQSFTSDSGTIAAYCSSPIPRNYGEGDVWEEGQRVADRNSEHGYRILDLGEDTFDWFPLSIPEEYHTIRVSSLSDIPEDIGCKTKKVHVKLQFLNNPSTEEKKQAIAKVNGYAPEVDIDIDYDHKGLVSMHDADREAMDDAVDSVSSHGNLKAKLSEYFTLKKYSEGSISDALALFDDIWRKIDAEVSKSSPKMLAFGADMFRNVGNISVDVEEGHVLEMVAENGVGKTTMLQVIPTAIWGFNAWHNSANSIKKDALSYFNLRAMDSDKASVWVDFIVDGEVFRAKREFFRQWKYNKPKYSAPNWKDYVKGVDIHLSVSKQGDDGKFQVEMKDDEAQDWLIKIWGTYGEYREILETTSDNMSDIINMPPEKRIDLILSRLGLDFLAEIQEKAKQAQKAWEDGRTIHKISEKDAEAEIENLLADIADAEGRMEAIDSENQGKSTKIPDLVYHINKLSEKLQEVDKDMLAKADSAPARIENLKKEIERSKSEVAKLKEAKSNESDRSEAIESAKKQIASLQDDLKALQSKLNMHSSSKEAYVSQRRNAVEEAESLKKSWNRDKQNRISEIDSEIAGKRSEYQTMKNSLLEQIATKLTGVKGKKASAESAISHIDSVVKMKRDEKSSLMSGVCNICGMEKKEIATIQKRISEIDSEVASLLEDRSKNEGLLSDANGEIENLENSKVLLPDNEALVSIQKQGLALKAKKKAIEDEEMPQSISDKVSTLEKQVSDLSEKVEATTGMVKEAETDIAQLRTSISEAQSRLSAMEDNTLDYDGLIAILEKRVDTCNQQIGQLDALMESAVKERRKQEANDGIRSEIKDVEARKNELENAMKLAESERNDLQRKIAVSQERVGVKRKELAEYHSQQKKLEIFKMVKKAFSKKELPVYIFMGFARMMNAKMAEILEGLPYSVYFNTDVDIPELYFIDHTSENMSEWPVVECSGMERTFAMLALIPNLVLHSNRRFNFMVVDEITGKLKGGFKAMAADVIAKVAGMLGSLILIDPVIDSNLFSNIKVVELEKNGEYAYRKQ